MFHRPEVMEVASARAAHAVQRQEVIAANIANADTPGYRAREALAFGEVWKDAGEASLRRTRPAHLGGEPSGAFDASIVRNASGTTSPNGNSVSIEAEMVAAAAVRKDHDLALAVYRTSLDILRTSLGRR